MIQTTWIRKNGLLVAMALSLHLAKNIYTIVIAKGSRHFVVIHGEVVLLNTPQSCQSWRVNYLEDASLNILPRYETLVPLSWII